MGRRLLDYAGCKKLKVENMARSQKVDLMEALPHKAEGPMDSFVQIDHGCGDQIQLQLLLLRHDVLVNLICLSLALILTSTCARSL